MKIISILFYLGVPLSVNVFARVFYLQFEYSNGAALWSAHESSRTFI